MKKTIFLFMLAILTIDSFADNGDGDKYRILLVEKGFVSIIDIVDLVSKSVSINKIYEFNEVNVSVVAPQFLNSNIVLFCENDRRNKIGRLKMLALENGRLDILYEGRRFLQSPRISPDKSKVAFLVENISDDHGLFVYDLINEKTDIIVDSGIYAAGTYNYNISWINSSNNILYSNEVGDIILLNINTGEKRFIIKGYDPDSSPNGEFIMYKKIKSKPYAPYVYNISKGTEEKVKGFSIYNAKWLPSGDILLIKSAGNLFNMDEWKKELVIYNGNEKVKILDYRGYEY